MTKLPFVLSRQVLRVLALGVLLNPVLALASEGAKMEPAGVDLNDKASLQRGAGLYMSYCSGCHAISYQRYSRMGEDLGLSAEEVEQNLIPNGQKIGETINTGIKPVDGLAFFGKAPPDLSVEARAKAEGPDWIYNYLKSFYIDESRPSGWNNTVFPGASMPNPLWEMQGIQHPKVEAKAKGESCAHGETRGGCVVGFEVPDTQKGTMSEAEFDAAARDISAFLAYTGEPAALRRQSMGVWVVLYLALFTLLAYLLKSEYWRDVH
jgi:ubiquinol-cytochrome c reductase cytochrome c1 subunit